jgi:predicted NBD/HSP70 family sugar kinase
MGGYESNHTTSKNWPFYIGIDIHKHYSVFCVIDERNTVLERGRIKGAKFHERLLRTKFLKN